MSINKADVRQANTDSTTADSQVEITQFRDTGVKTDQSNVVNPSRVISKISNPYPDQTPVEVLSRMFKVAEFPWTGGVPVTNTLDFPRQLLSIPVLAERMKPFRWARSDLKIQVKINSTQFHYGAYMISYIQNHTGFKHANNVFQQSGNRPIVLSASVQDSCEFNINWMNPYNFFEVNDPSSQIARVFFTPLTPLGVANENVTDTVQVQVYAGFVQPETSGYIAQSSVIKESKMKSKFSLADGPDLVKSIFEKIPIISGIVEDFGSMISALDKPASLEATGPIEFGFSREMSKGVGLDPAQSLSLQTLAPVDMTRELMGEEIDYMNILKVAQTPMITLIQKHQGNSNPINLLATPLGGPLDYFQFISRHFNYWRGSIKYLINFYTSNFTSCRYRISMLYDNTIPDDNTGGDVISSVVDVRGDTQYEFTAPYLWPTAYRSLQTSGDLPRLVIQPLIPIIGPSFEEDPAIQIVVWRAAGEDIKYNQLVTYDPNLYPMQMDPQAHFKKTFKPITEGSCFIREQGTISGENIQSTHDVIKRYVTGSTLDGNKLITYPNPTLLGAYHTMSACYKYWRGSRRVKTLLKYDTNLTAFIVLENPTASLNAGNAMAFTPTQQWPSLSIEVPWYSSLPFLPVRPNSVPVYDTTDNPREPILEPLDPYTGGSIFLSAGDDFLYGLLVAPDLSAF
jgi:hypothetical protein